MICVCTLFLRMRYNIWLNTGRVSISCFPNFYSATFNEDCEFMFINNNKS